jgi:MHS family proline/betaine transporter-like MFS transporter
MEESPDFIDQQSRGTVPENPLRHAFINHRAGIWRGFAISALGSITYYVGIAYVPAFLVSAGILTEGRSLQLSTIAAIAVILVTPVTGALADRFGRKPVLILLAGASAVLPVSMFYLMTGSSYLNAVISAVILACLAGAVSAVGAIATAEQFPGEGRVSGLALGATSATVIFGGLAPYVAQLLTNRTGSLMTPGVMIAVVALGVLPVLFALPETAPARTRFQ